MTSCSFCSKKSISSSFSEQEAIEEEYAREWIGCKDVIMS